MSRVAKNPIPVPKGVEITLSDNVISVKGAKGQLRYDIDPSVKVIHAEAVIQFEKNGSGPMASVLAGTARAVVNNMVTGVSKGFEKRLTIIGVGYRAAVQGKKLNLTLGYSHPIQYSIPEGITIETPSQTEVVVKGADKQKVGQAAAEIRDFRPPEPYKGKGIRYADEHVVKKEAKKK
jgi:large subunit ribosomal protein L6